MFIFNLKLNTNKLLKFLLIIIIIIVLIILGIAIYRVFNNSTTKTSDEIPSPEVTKITTSNYTNILKTVHDNLDDYLGMNINFSGYVYRVSDINEDEFIVARDMIINSDFQTLVVGFLCKHPDVKNYPDGTWVDVTGKIAKGNYHGDIPIVEINKIKKIDVPNDEYVYPPDDFYIPTSGLL